MLAWLKENAPRVMVDATEVFTGTPVRTWRLFRVVSHPLTPFPFTTVGFPTIASSGVQTSDDTTAQEPPETFDWGTLSLASTPLLLILAGVAVFALSARPSR